VLFRGVVLCGDIMFDSHVLCFFQAKPKAVASVAEAETEAEAGGEAEESVCQLCSECCANYEELQIHMLTACKVYRATQS
jgi:hypothetical protein